MQIHAHLLPALTTPAELTGQVVVVIDVLRATTTIAHALAAGAACVIPCLEVEAARLRAAEIEGALLGGERNGVAIEGFDCGNSPLDYTAAKVAGRTIVFTTTNGTRAMMLCKQAERVLTGAFVNFSAICDEVSRYESVHLLCAGTNGEVTREDALFAGAVASEIAQQRGNVQLNDQAAIASSAWRECTAELASPTQLLEALRASRGGRNMIDIGRDRDIEIAAQIDRFEIAPALNLQTWRIEI